MTRRAWIEFFLKVQVGINDLQDTPTKGAHSDGKTMCRNCAAYLPAVQRKVKAIRKLLGLEDPILCIRHSSRGQARSSQQRVSRGPRSDRRNLHQRE